MAEPVLGNIEEVLETALAAAAGREQAAVAALRAGDRESSWRALLRRLDVRPDGLDVIARQAEQAATSVDEALASCAEAAARWLQAAAETQQKLAHWAERSV